MTDFGAFITNIASQNATDKDFAMLVDMCELTPTCDKDTFAVRILRVHNMIHSLHMNGCVTDSSYLGNVVMA